jgi:hypothetical protein
VRNIEKTDLAIYEETFIDRSGKQSYVAQYFEKGLMRMALLGNSVDYGLPVVEMMRGKQHIGLGDDDWMDRGVPCIRIIGDDKSTLAPTYHSFSRHTTVANEEGAPDRRGK